MNDIPNAYDSGEVVLVGGFDGMFADEVWIKSEHGESWRFYPTREDISKMKSLCENLPWWHEVKDMTEDDGWLCEGWHYVSRDIINQPVRSMVVINS